MSNPPSFPRWVVVATLAFGGVLVAYGLVLLVVGYADAATVGLPPRSGYFGAFFLFLFAAIPLFIGEMMRRGDWRPADRTILRGGRVVATVRQLPLATVVAWAVVPLAFWVVLVVVPVGLHSAGAAFTAVDEGFWMFSGFYAFTSAAIFGVFLGSLVRRASFARARTLGLVAPERWREAWRVISGGARVELVLVAIGVGALGIIPLVVDDAIAVMVLTLVGVVLALLGVLMATQAWRSGEGAGYAESAA